MTTNHVVLCIVNNFFYLLYSLLYCSYTIVVNISSLHIAMVAFMLYAEILVAYLICV